MTLLILNLSISPGLLSSLWERRGHPGRLSLSRSVTVLHISNIKHSSTLLQAERKLLDYFNSNPKFQSKFLTSLVGDCLYETITGLCSGYLVAASAREKKDRMLLAWIQEEVIGE